MRTPFTEADLERIYDEHVDTLYGFVSRRCGGQRELAEDVTQETWFRAVREWRAKGLPGTPLAWLTTVARNLLLNLLRRREHISLDGVSPAEVLAAVEDNAVAESVEVASLVNCALARIPSGEARLLEAFHYEQRKVSQLAESYGISERAIEGRLRRARERLRHELTMALNASGGIG
jgi:RNA polymerase sigma-70 factor (ECF subfamily)